MTTLQKYRLGIYEGILYIFGKASEAMDAGSVVTLDTTSGYPYFKKCAHTDQPFGLCAEKVTVAGVADYEPGGLVSHTAKVGDYVGVYINGGVYNVPGIAMPYAAKLYASAGSF